MKYLIWLILFPAFLFGQTVDFSDVTNSFPYSMPDTTDYGYPTAGVDSLKATEALQYMADIREIAAKLGIGTDTPGGTARYVLITAGGDSTNWRALEAADIPSLVATYEAQMDNSAGLHSALSDETGTGVAVFGTSPTFTTSIVMGSADLNEAELEIIDGGTITTAELNALTFVLADTTTWNAALQAGDNATVLDGTNWRVLYIDGSGNVTELALGADGTYLKSNGASSAPTFATPASGSAFNRITIDTLAGQTGNTIFLEDTLIGLGTMDTLNVSNQFQLGGTAIVPTAIELNYVDGVTSAIQTQFSGKEASLTDVASLQNTISDVTTFYTEDTVVPVADGGSGASTFTDGGLLLGSGTDAFTALGAASNGQIPIGDGTSDPVLATITAGAGITITNGSGTITVAQVDTFTWNWGVMDTVVTGDLPGWKVPFGITVISVSAYTDANTTTFNLEERAAATPNVAGTNLFAADMVAVSTALDSTSFTNPGFANNTWMVPAISATGDVSIFGVTVEYIKQ